MGAFFLASEFGTPQGVLFSFERGISKYGYDTDYACSLYELLSDGYPIRSKHNTIQGRVHTFRVPSC